MSICLQGSWFTSALFVSRTCDKCDVVFAELQAVDGAAVPSTRVGLRLEAVVEAVALDAVVPEAAAHDALAAHGEVPLPEAPQLLVLDPSGRARRRLHGGPSVGLEQRRGVEGRDGVG